MTQTNETLVICVGERVSAESADVMRRLRRASGWRFVMIDWLHSGDLIEAAAMWLVDAGGANRSLPTGIPQNVPVLCPENHPEIEWFGANHRIIRFRSGLDAEIALLDLAKRPQLAPRAAAAVA